MTANKAPSKSLETLEVVGYPELEPGTRISADVAVIGSGAGGAVVAEYLAAAGASVAVIEEGRYYTEQTYGDDAAQRLANLWRSGPETVAVGSTPIYIPAGRAVGGSTVINSGSCFRTPERVLLSWKELGLDQLAPESMEPIFEEVEQKLSVRPVPDEIMGRNGELVRRGAEALGLSGGPIPRNIDGCQGSGICVLGCPTGAKQAMHRSYLPAAQSHGARIYERLRADRFVVSDGRVSSVACTLLDRSIRPVGEAVVEAKEIVVAAGPFHTPNLLATLDPPPEGAAHLGKHLQIHPCAGVLAAFDDDVEGFPNTVQSYFIDEFATSHGIMLEATSLVPGLNPGRNTKDKAFLGVFCFDRGEGEVLLEDGKPPRPRYELLSADLEALAFGVYQGCRIFLAAGARWVRTGHPGLPKVFSEDQAEKLLELEWEPSYFVPTAYHPCSTARMGIHPDVSVTSPQGRVWGYENLVVADASVLPSCPQVNPQITVMAIARKIAESMASSPV
jgi:choline dehydrogenase-like flavoprotein